MAALLLVHAVLGYGGAWRKSATYDELAHITAGLTFWRLNDYRLQPENGNLPQRLAALPLAVSGAVVLPGLDQPAWRRSDVWAFGDQLFHRVGNDAQRILRISRAAMTLASAALCLAVFLWARSLYGTAGGFIALVLCVFSPNLLANGPLATSDVCAALFFLLSARTLWSLLRRISLPGALACAASLSGLALSKTSAVLIFPMAAGMVLVALLRGRELTLVLPGRGDHPILPAGRRLIAMCLAVALCALVAWGAVWTGFGWRYSPAPPGAQESFERYYFPGHPIASLEEVAEAAGAPGRVIGLLGRLRLFPEAFLYGTAYVLASAHHYAFLNGEVSVEGWRMFFPYAFLVKSTLPLLVLLVTALAAAAAARLGRVRERPPAPPRLETAPLWVLLAVYAPALIFSTINIGARHMLPVYPALFVLLGGLARWAPATGVRRLVVLLLCWHAVEGLRGFPDYLAYFNQITGRRQAYRHLVDSNLDWGQDLPGLRRWLERRAVGGEPAPVYLSYFGSASPAAYGVNAEPLDLAERFRAGYPPEVGAGTFCVSATNLQAVYLASRGRWTPQREAEYRELGRRHHRLQGLDPRTQREEIQRMTPEDAAAWERFLDLGTARLMAFLRGREPDDRIGFSILCYDLSGEDLRRAFAGAPPEVTSPDRPGNRDR